MIWLYLIVALLVLFLFYKLFKIPKFGNLVLVTGGVKTGKSTMTIWLAQRQYWRAKRKYYIWNYVFYPVLHRLPFKKCKLLVKREYPLFYSNIPVAIKGYTPITHELIRREHRFRYGSVVYLGEASLIADSMTYKDSLLNEQALLLLKLCAHETKGGYFFVDTQSIQDLHYSFKRTISDYFYIHHLVKTIPFFMVAYVRELKYSEDNNSINTFDSDVEDTLKRVLIPKFVWKMFDCYCYSCFTDHLPVEDRQKVVTKYSNKKAKKIVTFRKFASLERRFVDNEKEN